MLDQLCVWFPIACDFYVMSVQPFIFDRVAEQQVTKAHKTVPVMIGDHEQNSIVWNVYSRNVSLEVDAMFKSNITNDNNIKDIRKNYIE